MLFKMPVWGFTVVWLLRNEVCEWCTVPWIDLLWCGCCGMKCVSDAQFPELKQQLCWFPSDCFPPWQCNLKWPWFKKRGENKKKRVEGIPVEAEAALWQPPLHKCSERLRAVIGRSCHRYHFCCNRSFVMTNICLSQQNMSFVMTKVCLSWQNCCHDKHVFCLDKYLSRQKFCRDKIILSWHT